MSKLLLFNSPHFSPVCRRSLTSLLSTKPCLHLSSFVHHHHQFHDFISSPQSLFLPFPSSPFRSRNLSVRAFDSSSDTQTEEEKKLSVSQDGKKLEEDYPTGEFEFKELSVWTRFLVKFRMLVAFPWQRVRKGSVLTMKFRGQISDQLQSRFSSGLSLPQICENFTKAAYDPRIAGIYLHIDPLDCGWAKVEEICRHISNYKKSAPIFNEIHLFQHICLSTFHLQLLSVQQAKLIFNMKPYKSLVPQLTKHKRLKLSSFTRINHCHHSAPFTSTPNPKTSKPQTDESLNSINNSTNPSPEITHHSLLNSIESSQWHFIKHLAPNLTPSLISTTLLSLYKRPDLALQFVTHIGLSRLDIKNKCLAVVVVSRSTSPKPTVKLLKEIVGSGNATTVKEVFDELVTARDQLSCVSNVVFDMLIRACCELRRGDYAFECFELMKGIGIVPKTETCNDMLSLFLKLNRTQAAWIMYAEMFRLGITSTVYTYNIMINVLCKEGKLKKAKEFIGLMESLGIQPTAVTYNTLIHGYCWRGRVEGAQMIIDAMKHKGIKPDSYTYGSLISGMCKEGRLEEASGLLEKMKEFRLKPNAVTYNTLIDGYCNKGDLEKAFRFRVEMVGRGILPTVSTYNLLIHALFMEAKIDVAENMMKDMGDKGIVPDSITYNILINGFCRCGNAKKAFSLHDEMVSKGLQPTLVTYTSLIYVLGKRNRMQEADSLFEGLVSKGVFPDLIMFNALIDGHCANGNMVRAFELLKEMDRRKVVPDEVTFNTLMRGRCVDGKVEEARELIEEMKRRGINPDHISYNTLISGYSKRGDMNDALRVRDEMLSIGFNPTLLTYNALIQGLCKNQEGEHAEELLREMVSNGITPDDSTYISLIEGLGKDYDSAGKAACLN